MNAYEQAFILLNQQMINIDDPEEIQISSNFTNPEKYTDEILKKERLSKISKKIIEDLTNPNSQLYLDIVTDVKESCTKAKLGKWLRKNGYKRKETRNIITELDAYVMESL